MTKAILNECGSYGSRLHVAENDEYVGYAQWSDSQKREKCELQDASVVARKLMREAIEYSYPDQKLDIISDFLVHPK